SGLQQKSPSLPFPPIRPFVVPVPSAIKIVSARRAICPLSPPVTFYLRTLSTMSIIHTRYVALIASLCIAAACSEITVPNYNNPSLEQLTTNPTSRTVNTAVVGMTINLRGRVGTEASSLGILGNDSYNLDQADPGNALSFLQGPIEPGGFVQDLGWT